MFHRGILLKILFSTGMLIAGSSIAMAGNIALGKTVMGNGIFFQGGWGNVTSTSFSTLTNGVYLPNWQQWDQGAIWWDTSQPQSQNNYLTVYLGATDCLVNRLEIQVDNNDDYKISWDDANGKTMTVPVIPARNGGLAPPVVIKVKATTHAFKIKHDENGEGDNYYAVAQFKAFGSCPQK